VPYLELEKESLLRRTLTKHVVTRYYRAPEIILLKDYTSKVDIWSVGCILAELLGMQKDSVPDIDCRTALFPGRSCYPLSDECKYDENGILQQESDSERLDQLNVIFEVIGTPSDEDILRIKEEKVRELISNMQKYKATDFGKLYAGASSLAIDLLQSMLQFDPNKRISVDDALHHPYFHDLLPEFGFLENIQPMSDEIETNCEEDGNLRNSLISEIVSFREVANMDILVDTDTEELSLSTHSNQALDF
jgi:mitogen-activated protein kinase 1/3